MKISTGTITRTALLALALLNQILNATGHSPLPIDDQTITDLITTSLTVITAVWSWWKNNSITQAALKGDEVMNAKKGK